MVSCKSLSKSILYSSFDQSFALKDSLYIFAVFVMLLRELIVDSGSRKFSGISDSQKDAVLETLISLRLKVFACAGKTSILDRSATCFHLILEASRSLGPINADKTIAARVLYSCFSRQYCNWMKTSCGFQKSTRFFTCLGRMMFSHGLEIRKPSRTK